MRRVPRRRVLAATGAAATAGCLGADPPAARMTPEVRVGSKQFTANRLLAWMAFESLLETDGVQPVHRIGLARTDGNWSALAAGDIHCYWDYTGTVWQFLLGRTERFEDPDALHAAIERTLADSDLSMVSRASYDNSYVLIANADWAETTGIAGLSGFVAWLNDGNAADVDVVMEAGFAGRPDGWGQLLSYYGIDPKARETLAANTTAVDAVLTYQDVEAGTYDVGLGFSTNPNLRERDLVTLADDDEFFPPYQPVLLANERVASRQPVREALAPIGGTLEDVSVVRRLSWRVLFGGESARAVARDHLTEVGLL